MTHLVCIRIGYKFPPWEPPSVLPLILLGPLIWERLQPGGTFTVLPDTLSTWQSRNSVPSQRHFKYWQSRKRTQPATLQVLIVQKAYLASDTSSTGSPESVPSQRRLKYWQSRKCTQLAILQVLVVQKASLASDT